MHRIILHQQIQRIAILIVAIVLVIPIFPLSQGRAAAAGGTTLFMNGQTAMADASSQQPWTQNGPPLGANNIYVEIFQTGTSTNRQTRLFYNVCTFQNDPVYGLQCVTVTGGFGTIPDNAVQVTGGARPSTMTLSIDTSSLSAPSFQNFGPGGLISLTWMLTPGSSFSSSGATQSTFGYGGQDISYTTAGSRYSHSAQAQGSIVGYPLPIQGAYNSADLGSSQGVSLCRGCPPPPSA